MKKRARIVGCQAYSFLGLWYCTEEAIQTWLDAGWAVIERGELQAVQQRSAEREDQLAENPYRVIDGIAHMDVAGPLTKHATSMSSLFGGTAMTDLQSHLGEIRQDKAIRGVMLNIDSPGGTADGITELAEAIRRTDSVKPVFAHASDTAASAALWVGTQARRFTAGPAAMVGSLGTYAQFMDRSEQAKDAKVKPVLIKAGEFKAIGAPGLPITDSQKAELQRRVDSMNNVFISQVQAKRQMTPAQLADVTTARVYVGEQAKQIGLVDGICSSEEAHNYMRHGLATGTVLSGPASGGNNKAAPTGSTAMALSAEQLRRARLIPGAAQLNDEQIEPFLLERAEQAQITAGEVNTLRQAVTAKDQEIAALKDKAPKAPDPAVHAREKKIAARQIQLHVKEGKMLPAQTEGFTKLLDEVPAMLQEGTDGAPVYEKVLALFDGNKPNGLLTDTAGDQPAPRQQETTKSSAPSFEEHNAARAEYGFPAHNMEEYKAAWAHLLGK